MAALLLTGRLEGGVLCSGEVPVTNLARPGQPVQFEDVLLLIWLAAVEPVLQRLLGAGLAGRSLGQLDVHTPGAPLLGIFFVIGGVCLCVCLLTKEPGVHYDDMNAFIGTPSGYARLPLMPGLLMIFTQAADLLGRDLSGWVLSAIFAVIGLSLALYNRLPALDSVVRRILMTPMILLGSWAFSSFMSSVVGGANLRSLAIQAFRSSSSDASFFLFILVAASGVFYLMFVFAPRQIASGGHAWLHWIARYAIYVLGLILNIAWLQGP